MKQRIITLKDRIDKNYKQLKKKNVLIEPMSVSINNLLNSNPTNDDLYQYLNKHDNIIFTMEYYLETIEHIKAIKEKRELLLKHKSKLQNDYILVKTALNVLEYLLSEDITNNELIKLFNNISNTIKIIEDKIDSIKKGKR